MIPNSTNLKVLVIDELDRLGRSEVPARMCWATFPYGYMEAVLFAIANRSSVCAVQVLGEDPGLVFFR